MVKIKKYKVKTKLKKIKVIADLIISSLKNGGTVYTCGNGGSASQANHFAAELIGKYEKKRGPLRSISLSANEATLTCISNDFGYEDLFSRQIKGLGKKSDILITFSTSGKSRNIYKAIIEAKKNGLKTISFLGKNGGFCKGISDQEILIKKEKVSIIQEEHLKLCHYLCGEIDKKFN